MKRSESLTGRVNNTNNINSLTGRVNNTNNINKTTTAHFKSLRKKEQVICR